MTIISWIKNVNDPRPNSPKLTALMADIAILNHLWISYSRTAGSGRAGVGEKIYESCKDCYITIYGLFGDSCSVIWEIETEEDINVLIQNYRGF